VIPLYHMRDMRTMRAVAPTTHVARELARAAAALAAVVGLTAGALAVWALVS
jgi:hypothetical protein